MILTFDIDWAPDFVIQDIIDILAKEGIKATWFVTHQGQYLGRLRDYSKLFELGIHPNLLPGSTQGSDERAVLKHLKSIVPEAVSMRTHCLYQSSHFLQIAANEYSIQRDVSILLPNHKHLKPHKLHFQKGKILRLPFFWEDDVEMLGPDNRWDLEGYELNYKGLKIWNFHPVHIALNTRSMIFYERLKTKKPLNQWDREFINKHQNSGLGTRTLFRALVKNYDSNCFRKIEDITLN